MSRPERQVHRIGSPLRSPSPIRNANRSPAPFSSRKITSITMNSVSRPGTPTERSESRIEVITPDVYYYEPKNDTRYTPDFPNRMQVQAPTNYNDFMITTPVTGRQFVDNTDVKVTKIFKKSVGSSPGPHRKMSGPQRKISTGSNTSSRPRSRIPDRE